MTTQATSFRPARAPSMPFLIAVFGAIVVVVIIAAAWSSIVTLAFGLALACLALPLVDALERRGVRRSIGALMIVVGLLIAVAVVAVLCAGVVVSQGGSFSAALPGALAQIQSDYEGLNIPAGARSSIDAAIVVAERQIGSLDLGSLSVGLLEGVFGIAGVIGALAVVPFFMFYVLVDQPSMRRRFYASVPASWRTHVEKSVSIFVADFAEYFRAEFIVGMIVGVAVAVGCFAIGAIFGGPLGEFAMLLGLFAAVMELVPSIGPVLSYVPALLLAVTTSPAAVVAVSIFYFVLFNIEGSVLVPTIEGSIVRFDRATVLALVAIGFGLGGMTGAILAMPVASIARDLFDYVFKTAVEDSAATPGNEASNADLATQPT
jgi:predicted PurR-regulated permease PerM